MALLISTGANLNNQELLNFRVESGETFNSGMDNYKQPIEGKMMYDATENVMRFGYKSYAGVKWATFLTTANFNAGNYMFKISGEAYNPTFHNIEIGNNYVPKSSLVVREDFAPGPDGENHSNTNYNSNSCPRIGFAWPSVNLYGSIKAAYNTNGGTSFVFNSGDSSGFFADIEAKNATFDNIILRNGNTNYFLKGNGAVDSTVYASFASYGIEAVKVDEYDNTYNVGGTVLKTCFNTAKNEFATCFVITKPSVSQEQLEKHWFVAGFEDTVTGLSGVKVRDLQKRGKVICVEGKLYQYITSWKLVYNGADASAYETRISTLENALRLDETADKTINTWNEVVNFLKTVDTSKGDLATTLTNINNAINLKADATTVTNLTNLVNTKANSSDVLLKPANTPSQGDVLTYEKTGNNGNTDTYGNVWRKRKIVATGHNRDNLIYEDGEIVNNEWNIDIDALGTEDVAVSVFKENQGKWDMILADVFVESYSATEGQRKRVRIVFGGTLGYEEYKAVIIA